MLLRIISFDSTRETVVYYNMVITLVAAIVAHLAMLWRKSEDKLRPRNSLFIFLDTPIINLVGLTHLLDGFSR
jgi:hypothetical protein